MNISIPTKHLMTYDDFYELGNKLMNINSKIKTKTGERRFREHFGVSPYVAARVWIDMKPISKYRDTVPEYLLWILLFLNNI